LHRTLALLGASAVLLVGCGSATKTVDVPGPPTQAVATTALATATTSSTATGGSPAAEAPKHTVHVETFLTPTGNIGCVIVSALARCDIVARAWSLPPRPSSCPQIVNFGQGLEVGPTSPARFVCAGDTARNQASQKLPYGTASEIGSFVCVSRATGLTCTSSSSGHGFQISRQRYQLF